MSASRVSVLVLLLAACSPLAAGPGSAPVAGAPPEDSGRRAFWTAVSEMDLRAAERRAPDGEHRRFARALRNLTEGRVRDAEAPLAQLNGSAEDSLLRTASHVALSAALEFQGKWGELGDLSHSLDHTTLHSGQERAAIELWARVMRLAPAPVYEFPSEPVVLPFLSAPTGTPVVNVRVNGVSQWFWIDTGSSVTLIASDVAKEVGAAPLAGGDSLLMVTAVGTTRAHPATVRRLEIGPLVISGLTAAIVDERDLAIEMEEENGKRQWVKVDGVIGMDVIRRLNLEIDYSRERVRILRPRPNAEDPDRPRNLLWLGAPVVRMEQKDGRPLYFGLDTGADLTFATHSLIAKLPKRVLRKQRQRIAGFGGDTTMTVPTLPTLQVSVGNRKFSLSDVAIHAPKRLGFIYLDGVLGTDAAAGLSMRIDVTSGVFEIGIPWLR